MDRNVRKGKTGNCRTIADITMVWTGNALFISFLILESDKKAFNQMRQWLRIYSIFYV